LCAIGLLAIAAAGIGRILNRKDAKAPSLRGFIHRWTQINADNLSITAFGGGKPRSEKHLR
jgi:hypothetical protein